MNSAICTLFEGHYHIGLAAFVNSLHACGYRGGVWAGYRGPLPPWAHGAVEGNGVHTFEAGAGLLVHFVPVETKRHLTNFKPDFLINARERFFSGAENVFYFDPDLVLRSEWPFFEQWAGCGVALCEDVNSPMPATHPVRMMWRRFYAPHGFTSARDLDIYVNGGFVGVEREDWEFVEMWWRLQDLMAPEVGGLADWGLKDRGFIFHKTDQDALNIAAMFCPRPVSIVGKDGMDLAPGGFLMSHALGSSKPWRKNFIREALCGFPPTMADKAFWNHTSTPIPVFSPREISRKRLALRIAAAIGRLISRS